MSNQSTGLRFDIYERIALSKDVEGLEELDEIECTPQLSVIQKGDQAVIKGFLELTGRYAGKDVKDPETLRHEIPVEITVPINRVRSLNDIVVELETFDIDLVSTGRLNMTGTLFLSGVEMKDEPKRNEPAESGQHDHVFIHEANDRFKPPFMTKLTEKHVAEKKNEDPEPNVPVSVDELSQGASGVEVNETPKIEESKPLPKVNEQPVFNDVEDVFVDKDSNVGEQEVSGADDGKESRSEDGKQQEKAPLFAPVEPSFEPSFEPSMELSMEPSVEPPGENQVFEPILAEDEGDSSADESPPQASQGMKIAFSGKHFSAEQESESGIMDIMGKQDGSPHSDQAVHQEVQNVGGDSGDSDSGDSDPDESETPREEQNTSDAQDALEWKKLFLGQDKEDGGFSKMRLCIVQKQDSLENIAERYELNPREIVLFNRLEDESIQAGQIIRIP